MLLKRSISILLLALFLFNTVGYYGVYEALRAKANSGLIERLDANDFNEDETITIKIPISIPYQSDWSGFERVDGEFVRDGKFYNLLKQKIEQDTLIIVAVRDHEEASLFESLVDFVQSNTDTPISQKAGKLIDSFSKDFLCTINELANASVGWMIESSQTLLQSTVSTVFLRIHTPPPR